MTDTGQVPGEGHPDNAGMVDQQSIPAPVPPQIPAGYAFQDLVDNPAEPEDEELLLMPSGQGAWSDPQLVPPPAFPIEPAPAYDEAPAYEQYAQQSAAPAYADPAAAPRFPEPAAPVHTEPAPVHPEAAVAPAYAEPAHPGFPDAGQPEPFYSAGAHEAGGRDSGSLDLGGLLIPSPAAPPVPPAPATPSRRPLHMGPPVPEAGGLVRSLADRGPAAPQTPVTPMPIRQAGPPTTGPEYLDIPRAEDVPAAPQGEIPPQAGAPWAAEPVLPAPEVEPVAVAVEPESETPVEPTPHTPVEAAPPAEAEPADAQPVTANEPEPFVVPEPAAEAVEPAETAVPAEVPVPAGVPVPAEIPAPADVVEAPAPAEAAPAPQPEPAPEPVVAVEPPPVVVEAAPEIPQPVEAAPPAANEAPEGVVAPVEPQPLPAEAAESAEAVAAPAEPQAVEQAPVEAAAPVETVVTPEAPDQPEAPEAPVEPARPEAPAEPAAPAEQPEPDTAAAHPVEPAHPVAVAPEEAPETPAAPAAAEPVEVEVPEPLAAAPVGEPAPAGYDEAERDAIQRVMRERRDIRKGFRSDPIPHEVLLRVLEAAHTAPSVGHSQPWDFVVIRSAETRRTMHELAQRQREAYAKSLPKGRAKQFKELKIEAILDTPVNIVVTADPTRGGRHTLGRHTQPQMAPYSSALAVENLWLAARAEGIGVGWVSFFDEREMVRELGLPEHLEVVAYLCVGYVDEFPEEPELAQAGWSQRRPLAWVVHEETYGRRALPGAEPHDLLSETVAGIRPLDAKALGEAWERQKRMTKPAGALGMLEIISAQLAGLSRVCPPPIPEPAAVAIFAGDHGVHAQGVTPWPQEVTTQMVANFLGGGAVCNAFANQVGAEVCVIDVGVAGDLPATPGLLPRKVRPGTADMSVGPAMTREEAIAAIEVGIETARDLVAAGNKALLTGEMGIANTTVSAALISVFTGVDPGEVTGRGTGINDETHARKVEVVRRALELHQPDPADPIGVLAAIGGLEHAAIVGLLLGGASLRTPVILDGVSAGAAALVARAIAPEALSACIAGHRSAEPGHVAALNKLGLRPLVDLDLRLGEGTGALLALPLVQSAARAMHEVATFDSAGVTEK
ncbi:nicotinate-nucleotide--dimethylbenzimidazole phosphoribosyltransferase [Streptomyces sp. NBC_00513]|uniref:nicotinate-nucleotide--dimethylbenzimidazole phosphoribosyltransferase n=1 Tax=unclassified Streptomyces TaxID=2593676 RepID=UPI002255499E|nr:nicotinate-nucleotide--dimethylbenzimidazole phosphoribosyltransferase [Streptomyces sp. NBC_00424]MCX5076381.1 nicotinate-nucleotide--dimethylbenzimidazole phosphoribosyltransferase [Streptomyces sp. NBC_00424]WUD40581.1 nicotinate-nucleotide--dimethylbenzimidazole phosphoribosyltransferase [Streptomyces sp. NBC_00513]